MGELSLLCMKKKQMEIITSHAYAVVSFIAIQMSIIQFCTQSRPTISNYYYWKIGFFFVSAKYRNLGAPYEARRTTQKEIIKCRIGKNLKF